MVSLIVCMFLCLFWHHLQTQFKVLCTGTGQARGPYDDLRQEDIGQRSHYDVIGLQPSQPTGNQDNDG